MTFIAGCREPKIARLFSDEVNQRQAVTFEGRVQGIDMARGDVLMTAAAGFVHYRRVGRIFVGDPDARLFGVVLRGVAAVTLGASQTPMLGSFVLFGVHVEARIALGQTL